MAYDMIDWGEGEEDSWKDHAGHTYHPEILAFTDRVAGLYGEDAACTVLEAYEHMGDVLLEPPVFAAVLGLDARAPLPDELFTPPPPEAFFVPDYMRTIPIANLVLEVEMGIAITDE